MRWTSRASGSFRTPTQLSFNVDLRKWYSTGSPDLADLPTVVDVCLDTDGVAGPGSTELLAGGNARVRAADAWEWCVTISREGAQLVSATGATQELEAGFVPETATLWAQADLAQLGTSDPHAPESWGYLVATLALRCHCERSEAIRSPRERVRWRWNASMRSNLTALLG